MFRALSKNGDEIAKVVDGKLQPTKFIEDGVVIKEIPEGVLVRKGEEIGFKKVGSMADGWLDDLPAGLRDDIGGSPDSELGRLFARASEEERLSLVEAWRKVDGLGDDAFKSLNKDPDFLKKFDEVVENSALNKHVLEGDISYEILETGQKKWKVGGVHHKTAFDNGTARIKSGTKSTPNTNGYYTAKVEVYHTEFPNNGGFKVKSKESTFFPNDWSVDKIQAEIAGAIKNKGTPTLHPDGRKLYKGTMTDGTELAIWEDAAGNITSTYPIF